MALLYEVPADLDEKFANCAGFEVDFRSHFVDLEGLLYTMEVESRDVMIEPATQSAFAWYGEGLIDYRTTPTDECMTVTPRVEGPFKAGIVAMDLNSRLVSGEGDVTDPRVPGEAVPGLRVYIDPTAVNEELVDHCGDEPFTFPPMGLFRVAWLALRYETNPAGDHSCSMAGSMGTAPSGPARRLRRKRRRSARRRPSRSGTARAAEPPGAATAGPATRRARG